LNIIGEGNKLEDYKKLSANYGLSKITKFYGHVSKEKVISLISQFGIGIAIYSNNQPYNKYGDSVKVRDYIAAGLPIITTNNHSTAKEVKINNLGIVINSKSKRLGEDICNAYLKLLKEYPQYKENCVKYYKKNYKNEEIIKIILK
jgi:glycosyltransferase involved in cell wall biosynthesis